MKIKGLFNYPYDGYERTCTSPSREGKNEAICIKIQEFIKSIRLISSL